MKRSVGGKYMHNRPLGLVLQCSGSIQIEDTTEVRRKGDAASTRRRRPSGGGFSLQGITNRGALEGQLRPQDEGVVVREARRIRGEVLEFEQE